MITFELIRKQDYITTEWSGGHTTQVYIFPLQSNYADRNFHFRISSATVMQEHSEFTSLPGFYRHIMLLDGEMHLQHQGHHSKTLKRYEQDSFEGSWTTNSSGKCTDYNLMLDEDHQGGLQCVYSSPVSCQDSFCGFYALADQLEVDIEQNGKNVFNGKMAQGDFLLIRNANQHPGCQVFLKTPTDETYGKEPLVIFSFVSAM